VEAFNEEKRLPNKLDEEDDFKRMRTVPGVMRDAVNYHGMMLQQQRGNVANQAHKTMNEAQEIRKGYDQLESEQLRLSKFIKERDDLENRYRNLTLDIKKLRQQTGLTPMEQKDLEKMKVQLLELQGLS
jgi:uncharacterized coiled-coil DUF342 family protein